MCQSFLSYGSITINEFVSYGFVVGKSGDVLVGLLFWFFDERGFLSFGGVLVKLLFWFFDEEDFLVFSFLSFVELAFVLKRKRNFSLI